jgi:hypothetical protein
MTFRRFFRGFPLVSIVKLTGNQLENILVSLENSRNYLISVLEVPKRVA